MSWISPWEEAWLVVDRMTSAGQFESPASAAKELAVVLRTSFINAVAIAVLCFETPDEGQRLAKEVAASGTCAPHDLAWVLWLGGDHSGDLAANLTDDLVGSTPRKALQAALTKQWSQAEGLLPTNLCKPFPKPVRPTGRMHGQVLAQLASHALRGEPTREVLDASLATLFRFFGIAQGSDWWSGLEVMTRLPLLALYAREFDRESAGAVLLHAQRKMNPHLVEPPTRTFIAPPEVIVATEMLESVLAAAAAGGRGLNVSLADDSNVYTVS